MDKQLEQKIRERAYELWLRNGSVPDRAEEFWYRAEREVLDEEGREGSGATGMSRSDETGPAPSGDDTMQSPVEAAFVPPILSDEANASPGAAKSSKKRAPTSVPKTGGDAAAKPRRKRTDKTP